MASTYPIGVLETVSTAEERDTVELMPAAGWPYWHGRWGVDKGVGTWLAIALHWPRLIGIALLGAGAVLSLRK